VVQEFLKTQPEVGYILVLFMLFVLPRVLQRWGIPAALTGMALGVVSGMGFGLFLHDHTIELLSSFGIVALFLFAGLEVDVDDLRKDAPVLAQHLVVRAALLWLISLLLMSLLHLEGRVAVLTALALLTPSTGFILDAIGMLGLGPRERAWVKSKAIATELLALLVLFATLQSTTWLRFLLSTAALAAMIVLLPIAFRAFARIVVPYAPRSEFAFLLMVAVVCAYVTRELGVYYLVGAFVVGMAAQRFRETLPSLASEELVRAVELFASFFVPFYFFHAGLALETSHFSVTALMLGAGFLLTMVPLRLVAVAVHRRLALGEQMNTAMRIAVPMLPTLVFGLVIATILRERFMVDAMLFGGIVLYTLLTTIIPAVVLRSQVPDFAAPHAPPLDEEINVPGEPSEAGR